MTAQIKAQDDLPSSVSDPRRYLWPLFYSIATASPLWAWAVWRATGGAAWTALIPLVVVFVAVPLLDAIVGEDDKNLSDSALKAMASDPFYLAVVRSVVPIGYATFIGAVAFVVTQDLPLWASLALIIGTATLNGSMITLGHELGHKTDPLNRLFARLALGGVGYGHFTAEHNLGHHRNVSTPEDCASGRLGESVYVFATREIPGALKGGWSIEAGRLKKRGLPVWSRHNEILQADAITLGVAALLVVMLGWAALPWIVLHHAVSWFALTLVNYIEHYGLLRQRTESGRYEPCAPRHSWNANHVVSNLVQFHLQRHSDHHAHPARPYQVLRSSEGLPTLPTGYPGCMLLALVPPFWFQVMDRKVLAWADGDLGATNIHEPARARLERLSAVG